MKTINVNVFERFLGGGGASSLTHRYEKLNNVLTTSLFPTFSDSLEMFKIFFLQHLKSLPSRNVVSNLPACLKIIS